MTLSFCALVGAVSVGLCECASVCRDPSAAPSTLQMRHFQPGWNVPELLATPAMLANATLALPVNFTTVENPESAECCTPSVQWPDVDNGVICASCTALVLTTPYGGRCDKYCENFGHVCVSAAEEVEENCQIKYKAKCDAQILDTSDMLCTCRLPENTGYCEKPWAPPSKRIEVSGRRLLVDGQPIHLKGVAWNPVRRGCVHPLGIEFASAVARDAELMANAGINAVRTYHPITDIAVLDVLWARGIWVVNGVYNFGAAAPESVIEAVNAVKHHPAILMWTIGNEWNYNGLYVHMSYADCLVRIEQVARIVRQHDPDHPVSTIYGDLNRLNEAVAQLGNDIDVFGINVYRGIDFGNLFDAYAGISNKPMYLGEYGADAYNALIGKEDQASQAAATAVLTAQIIKRSSVRNGGVCLGGFIFELTDEWWKDENGSPWDQDVGGVAPGAGPYPDMVFNEEWWGLMTIDRVPRLAFTVYSKLPIPKA